jgi:hypothetical protein
MFDIQERRALVIIPGKVVGFASVYFLTQDPKHLPFQDDDEDIIFCGNIWV